MTAPPPQFGGGGASVDVTESGQNEGAVPLAGEGSPAIADLIAHERVEIRSDGTAMDSAGTSTAEGGVGACVPLDSIGYATTERVLIR